MNKKNIFYLLLPVIALHALTTHASSPSSSPREVDTRPIPPTIKHQPSLIIKSIASFSQIYSSYDMEYADSDDENHENNHQKTITPKNRNTLPLIESENEINKEKHQQPCTTTISLKQCNNFSPKKNQSRPRTTTF